MEDSRTPPVPPRVPPCAGTRIHVLGLGKSGVGAARLAARLDCRVSATDRKPREDVPCADLLESEGVELDLGGHDASLFGSADIVVVSPGVPEIPALGVAASAGVDVISEVEFAYRCSHASVLGITGSNGKSTVTTMLGAILARSSRPVWTGGNLGTPPCEAVGSEADVPGGVFVLELSSFQLERLGSLRCEVATVLNVSPDHMDRYDGFAHYADTKGNVFVNQNHDDHAIVLAGENEAIRQGSRSSGQLHVIGEPGSALFEHDGIIEVAGLGGLAESFVAAELGLSDHLARINGMMAIGCAALAGADGRAIRLGFESFRPLAHRFETVGTVDGVRYIDDSKATNPASVVAALRASRGRVILIAGGLDKKLDYSEIAPAAAGKVFKVLLIGQASSAIASALGSGFDMEEVGSLDRAVERGSRLASPGDTVLLSPACASFDQFRSFEHRGDVFKTLVEELKAT